MTTKTTILLGAAAGAMMLLGAGGAWAAEAPTEAANCGLNSSQVNAGWTCTAETSTTDISREIGGGSRCQDATITTSTYRGYNPSGNLSDKVFESTLQSDWGSSYPKTTGGCTHPTS
jgi:hypothetical protein